jgi:hypothetical protein
MESTARRPPPPGYYWQNIEVVVACLIKFNLVPLGNVVTSSGNCRILVDFGYNARKVMVMGPSQSLPAPGPNTGLVTVTCNSASNGQWNWTITPNMTATAATPDGRQFVPFQGITERRSCWSGSTTTFRTGLTNP